MTRTQHVAHRFNCSATNRTVTISSRYLLHEDRNGKEITRAATRTSCSHVNDCAVATHHATGTSYDWSKCILKSRELN